MTRLLFTTVSGRQVDLNDPKPADIDFRDIAEQLAKEARYNGATPGCVYSVAQHLCLGADAMAAAGHTREAIAYFLLHDAPEAYLRDDTTPKKRAMAEEAARRFGMLAEAIMAAFDAVTERFDLAIHRAAGLPWPPPAEVAAAVHAWDSRILAEEWLALMPQAPLPAGLDPKEAIGAPVIAFLWPWQRAALELTVRFREYLPACGGSLLGEPPPWPPR